MQLKHLSGLWFLRFHYLLKFQILMSFRGASPLGAPHRALPWTRLWPWRSPDPSPIQGAPPYVNSWIRACLQYCSPALFRVRKKRLVCVVFSFKSEKYKIMCVIVICHNLHVTWVNQGEQLAMTCYMPSTQPTISILWRPFLQNSNDPLVKLWFYHLFIT